MTTLLEALTSLSDALRDHMPMVDCPEQPVAAHSSLKHWEKCTGGCNGTGKVPDPRFVPLRDAFALEYADGAVRRVIEDALVACGAMRSGRGWLYIGHDYEVHYTDAVSLCEGLTRLVMRDIRTWADYRWPEWVPIEVRNAIESFWREDWGRGPHRWMESAERVGAPLLGEVVTLRNGFSEDSPMVTGRFVFAWNNICRVVLPDGSYAYSGFP